MLGALTIPTPENGVATLSGSWKRVRYWDWTGTIAADAPIVALSLLRVGSRLEWARSEKGPKNTLEARLLLGWYDSVGRDVQVSFSLGQNGPYRQTLVSDAASPPKVVAGTSIPLGRVFTFSEPFGQPEIELFGLVLLREQVMGARNGLWHLKRSLRDGVSDPWREILCAGRSGSTTLPPNAA